MLTLWLEHRLGKDEILARYLNTAYFGAGAFGVDAAAKRYFGKSAKELSLSEAAMLAGLVRAPSVLAPNRNLDGARARSARARRHGGDRGHLGGAGGCGAPPAGQPARPAR
jgi:penicillin-binding protein 1A